jgi:uncharacterized protein (TIGR00661 family)
MRGDKKMINICFYISDYGYGHASRDIAVIRRILSEYNDVKVYIKTEGPFNFVRQSLPQKNVEVMQTKNDIGIAFKGNSVIVDRERTKKMLDEWLASWNEYIHTEKRFCKAHNINLILSDITPQPFIVADELDIPSIAISNFTWHYIFYNLFGDISATEQIKEAYQHADLALALPFNEEMNLFKEIKEISLVSREITRDKFDMRRNCGISGDEVLVYLGVGRSFDSSFLSNVKEVDSQNVKYLVSSNAELPVEDAFRIPTNETETQNYIAMCDLVVSKTGYSTASEAIRAKVPMFMFKREGYKEDELIANAVEELDIGRQISEMSFLDGDWINEMDNLNKYEKRFDSLEDRFKEDGTLEVIDAIKGVVL